MGRACSTRDRDDSVITSSVGKRSHGIPRYRLQSNIQLYLKLTVCESVDWIYLANYRVQ